MKPEEHQPAPANLCAPYQQQNPTLCGVSPFPGDPPKHFFGPPEYPLMIGCDQFHIIQDSCFAGEGALYDSDVEPWNAPTTDPHHASLSPSHSPPGASSHSAGDYGATPQDQTT